MKGVVDATKGKRQCNSCFEWKPKEEFWGNAKRCKKCDEAVKRERRDTGTTKRREERIELFKLMGDTCIGCGGRATLFHEIHGKEHPLEYEYYKNHKDDFVPLCSFCHSIIHSKRINVEKILELRKILRAKSRRPMMTNHVGDGRHHSPYIKPVDEL